ncbi:MAG: SDR family NAD(P)-dependent oxidoreductase [Desulfobulbus sp.]|nr:SDR family NAD(P)-dependent oxidoreductase [Desulfobulbus sp.]
MMEQNKHVWFITGANKGLGAAIAKEALECGFKVVAAARNPSSIKEVLGESPNLLPIRLDITNQEEIHAAVNQALDRFGRINVLVNNAGYGLLGYFEELSDKLVRQQMETNVFGTMNLTRAVLPVMRRQREGLVVTVSSTSGIKAVEGDSVYCASKFALEGWMEGMSIDLKPFGIRCLIIEPGPFRTDFFKEKTSFAFSDMPIEDYWPYREALYKYFVSFDQKQTGDPARLAKALMKVAYTENPPLRLLCSRFALNSVDAYLKNRYAEFDAWRELSASTDFNE